MKILISPSKTQSPSLSKYLNDKELLYPLKHKKVLATLRKLTKKDIESKMKLSKDLLNNTYKNIKNYNSLKTQHAFESFNGLVFKGLNKAVYKQQEYNYIEKNLLILDAFYGLLEPGTLIKEYRLDFNMNIGLNLYNHWDIELENELIINLASKEFSTVLKNNELVNIHFMQKKDDKFINQATYSKQARGMILNYMIIEKIVDVEGIKRFNLDRYSFNKELSDAFNIVFTR